MWGSAGENGAGKSTLLHVLSGALSPAQGQVLRHGSVGLAEQEITVDDQATVGSLIDVEFAAVRVAPAAVEDSSAALAEGRAGAEVAYAAALDAATTLDAWEADQHVDVALSALGAVADRSRLLAQLSVGERYRVRLACLLGAGHDFLLLDEPTNHLSIALVDELTDAFQHTPAAVVVATHDRQMLDDLPHWPTLTLPTRP